MKKKTIDEDYERAIWSLRILKLRHLVNSLIDEKNELDNLQQMINICKKRILTNKEHYAKNH